MPGVLKLFLTAYPFDLSACMAYPLKIMQHKVYAIEKTKHNKLCIYTFNAMDELDVSPRVYLFLEMF